VREEEKKKRLGLLSESQVDTCPAPVAKQFYRENMTLRLRYGNLKKCVIYIII